MTLRLNASAADFEVAQGDLEAAAEAGVLLDGVHAFSSVACGDGITWEKEIRVRLHTATAHTAA